MKRIITFVLIAALSLPAAAQQLSAEIGGGLGLDLGSKYEAQVSLIYGFNIGNHFYAGAGAGFRYAEMLCGEWTIANTTSDVYQTELNVPVFARLRYTFGSTETAPFAQVDGGWCFGVGGNLTSDGNVTMPEGYKDKGPVFTPRTQGFFYEPQVGYNFSSRVYASIGLMMQHYGEYLLVGTQAIDAKGLDWEDQYLVTERTYSNFATALTFHIGIRF